MKWSTLTEGEESKLTTPIETPTTKGLPTVPDEPLDLKGIFGDDQAKDSVVTDLMSGNAAKSDKLLVDRLTEFYKSHDPDRVNDKEKLVQTATRFSNDEGPLNFALKKHYGVDLTSLEVGKDSARSVTQQKRAIGAPSILNSSELQARRSVAGARIQQRETIPGSASGAPSVLSAAQLQARRATEARGRGRGHPSVASVDGRDRPSAKGRPSARGSGGPSIKAETLDI